MCQSHRHDSTHPSLFTELATTRIYVECSTAGTSHISHYGTMPSRTVTHTCISWTHDCLTSVIKHKTFAPCYVSPHKYTNKYKTKLTALIKSIKTELYPTGAGSPKFYGLPKIHKEGIPLRPIVSSIGAATYSTSKELS